MKPKQYTELLDDIISCKKHQNHLDGNIQTKHSNNVEERKQRPKFYNKIIANKAENKINLSTIETKTSYLIT